MKPGGKAVNLDIHSMPHIAEDHVFVIARSHDTQTYEKTFNIDTKSVEIDDLKLPSSYRQLKKDKYNLYKHITIIIFSAQINLFYPAFSLILLLNY